MNKVTLSFGLMLATALTATAAPKVTPQFIKTSSATIVCGDSVRLTITSYSNADSSYDKASNIQIAGSNAKIKNSEVLSGATASCNSRIYELSFLNNGAIQVISVDADESTNALSDIVSEKDLKVPVNIITFDAGKPSVSKAICELAK